jgi:hypothetical protein
MAIAGPEAVAPARETGMTRRAGPAKPYRSGGCAALVEGLFAGAGLLQQVAGIYVLLCILKGFCLGGAILLDDATRAKRGLGLP